MHSGINKHLSEYWWAKVFVEKRGILVEEGGTGYPTIDRAKDQFQCILSILTAAASETELLITG